MAVPVTSAREPGNGAGVESAMNSTSPLRSVDEAFREAFTPGPEAVLLGEPLVSVRWGD